MSAILNMTCDRTPLPNRNSGIGRVRFESRTVRAFKLPLEDRCEDFVQVATYRGSIVQHPHAFMLGDRHLFEQDCAMRGCGNTFDVLVSSRYASHSELSGDASTHFGLFDCGPGDVGAGTALAACC